MLNAKDLELLAAKGISEKQIEEQLACFVKRVSFSGKLQLRRRSREGLW